MKITETQLRKLIREQIEHFDDDINVNDYVDIIAGPKSGGLGLRGRVLLIDPPGPNQRYMIYVDTWPDHRNRGVLNHSRDEIRKSKLQAPETGWPA